MKYHFIPLNNWVNQEMLVPGYLCFRFDNNESCLLITTLKMCWDSQIL